MMFTKTAALLALALLTFHGSTMADVCVMPTGLDDGTGISFASLTLPGPPFGVFGTAAIASVPYLAKSETPIQMRNIHAFVSSVYGAAAAFEPNALEFLGRANVSEARRRCSNATNFAQHRAVSLAYTTLWHIMEFVPASTPDMKALATSWNLDLNICSTVGTCNNITTPWGLAQSILQDSKAIFAKDGWNADGSLSSTYNRIPYKDWRSEPYEPRNCKKCSWQPLEETNKLGFLFKQEHVTPHIGETARSYYLGDADICSRQTPDPNYDYNFEIQNTLNRTAALNDVKKMEIEFYDSKLTSFIPLQVQYFARQGISLDDWRFILADAVVVGTVYESVVVSWREKVRWDKIRPTTLIHEKLEDTIVYSYLGNSEKIAGNLSAKEWQPYIRIMPHSEYPSGSSCMCSAFAQAMISLTGSDDVTAVLGGPLQATFPIGSSRYEVGTPASNITLSYPKWTDTAFTCGQSRSDGGIHFTKSIPAGKDLCTSIGSAVYQYYNKLTLGIKPPVALSPSAVLVNPPETRPCPTR